MTIFNVIIYSVCQVGTRLRLNTCCWSLRLGDNLNVVVQLLCGNSLSKFFTIDLVREADVVFDPA